MKPAESLQMPRACREQTPETLLSFRGKAGSYTSGCRRGSEGPDGRPRTDQAVTERDSSQSNSHTLFLLLLVLVKPDPSRALFRSIFSYTSVIIVQDLIWAAGVFLLATLVFLVRTTTISG